ncbi:exonuclease SbcC [Modestobacter sp. I12A-02628]|uniref:Exonuclease SbcC n=2 Tax=Goekera deserti TaxID=2497753 RepID=A0A7K3WKD0_9ACTN|nr:exonuclease SbcC [Goekera deserti]NDI46563.1 exonuclease SbcC [Goekera deserti]NEL56319.1 exonuclease SbcC [Goekera deserti]
MPLSTDELREITGYAAHCARRVLPLFEVGHPDDPRPREAVEGAEAFAGGAPRSAVLRAQATAAGRAAAAAANPAAAEAARAAGQAAAAAYLHPLATPHQVKHVIGSAAHQARADELAAGGDESVGAAAVHWAVGQAPPAVRAVLRRMPVVAAGRGRGGDLLRELDAALRR